MPRTDFRFAFRRRVRYSEVDAQAVVDFAPEASRSRCMQVLVHVAEARGRPTPVPGWIAAAFERFEGRQLRSAQ